MKRHARSLGAKCLSCSWQHPDFDVAEGDHVPVVLQPDVALRVFPEARMRRDLLAATLEFQSGLPNSYSRSFTPLSQCSTWLPFTMRRAVFHSPPGFTAPRRAVRGVRRCRGGGALFPPPPPAPRRRGAGDTGRPPRPPTSWDSVRRD